MRNYILSIVAAAIVSGIACGLLEEKNTAGKIVRLLCGILIGITILSPIRDISFQNLATYFHNQSIDAQSWIAEGKFKAQQSTNDIIISKTKTYILDKANRMGLQIAVEVELDEKNNSIPCGLKLTGNISPYEKEMLGSYIADNLGIAKEKQQWT